MILFRVDDGETWTVVANDRSEALALYIEEAMSAHGNWPEEKPNVKALDPNESYTVDLDGTKVTLKGHQWLLLLSEPQVLAWSLI